MKRLIGTLLCLCILCASGMARAEFDYESIPTPNIIVVDGDDPSSVFYERAADQRAYPASTTKIMTCILAIEAGNLDESVTVGEEVTPFTNYSSLMGLKQGETVTMRDLVYGLMLPSGNDAGAAIAVHVAGSIDAFVTLMNNKAAELGMTGTHFTNPHGVHNDNHYSTARDLAKLMSYALQNDEFVQIDQTISYTVPASNVRAETLTLLSTNRLLRNVDGSGVDTYYPYAVGGKTGDTDMAGKCLVAVAEKDGAKVIVVLLGDKASMYGDDKTANDVARFLNARSIFEHVFNDAYQTVTGSELGLQTSFDTGVVNALDDDLIDGRLTMSADAANTTIRAQASQIAAYKASSASITASVELTTAAQAPIYEGQIMGSVRYELGGQTVCVIPLTADFEVRQSNEMQQITPEDASQTALPEGTPLITKGHKDWSTADFLTLAMVLLIFLLIALIVVFILSERKRRYERKRRAARARKRRRYE